MNVSSESLIQHLFVPRHSDLWYDVAWMWILVAIRRNYIPIDTFYFFVSGYVLSCGGAVTLHIFDGTGLVCVILRIPVLD